MLTVSNPSIHRKFSTWFDRIWLLSLISCMSISLMVTVWQYLRRRPSWRDWDVSRSQSVSWFLHGQPSILFGGNTRSGSIYTPRNRTRTWISWQFRVRLHSLEITKVVWPSNLRIWSQWWSWNKVFPYDWRGILRSITKMEQKSIVWRVISSTQASRIVPVREALSDPESAVPEMRSGHHGSGGLNKMHIR